MEGGKHERPGIENRTGEKGLITVWIDEGSQYLTTEV
jgi:hypothetical protein